MSQEAKAVNVRILDKDYKIACPEGEHASLITSAKYVDEQMRRFRQSGKVLSVDRMAVMVALNIAHDMINTKQQINTIDGDIIEKLEYLQERIQNTLANCTPINSIPNSDAPTEDKEGFTS